MKQNNPCHSRHSGYVAIVGRTNVGKSTFLNAILQAKVAIVSVRPQTTRKRILGIKTTQRGQVIFFDSPGIHKPRFKLNQRMMKEVSEALQDSDLILYFVEIGSRRQDNFAISLLQKAGKPVLLVLSKVDRFKKSRVLEDIVFHKDLFPWKEIVPLSSVQGDNLDRIEELIFHYLPEGDDLYPEDEWTRQSENFYVSELIREKLLSLIRDELPYITTVRLMNLEHREQVTYVQAEILVETRSQKKIMVGKGGSMIREIGQMARHELEDYFGEKVFLDLQVKIAPDWKNSDHYLRDIFN